MTHDLLAGDLIVIAVDTLGNICRPAALRFGWDCKRVAKVSTAPWRTTGCQPETTRRPGAPDWSGCAGGMRG